jgi:carbamoyl-phosphate synthase/aspartate carbamoyltransferase
MEFSLTQHLASNVIELYINLPSKNRYRRPASYSTKGYRTRRMAIDFDIPLITNVKCAKLLAEALVRKLPLNVSAIDSKTSHTTHILPGLINICAFVPGIATPGSVDISEVSKASVCGGFTTALLSPIGLRGSIVDDTSLAVAQKNAVGASHCNYSLSVAATSGNVKEITEEMVSGVKSLFIPFNNLVAVSSISIIASYISRWPSDKVIITDAQAPDLASVLLLASLHSRKIHVTGVSARDDLQLIRLSKQKNMSVTCDVAVYSLFYDKTSYPSVQCLPSHEDRLALWESLEIIDAFSIGLAPSQLAMELGKDASPRSGVEEVLPLLLSAVLDKQLTMEDIQLRLHDNPVKIFSLPEQPQTQVEVVMNRPTRFRHKAKCWSPLEGKNVVGSVNRVLIQGQTVFLDGASFTSAIGRDISTASSSLAKHVSQARRGSFASAPRTSVSDLTQSPVLTATGLASRIASDTALLPPSRALPTSSSALSFSLPRHHPAFYRRHILSVKQFKHQDIHDLFNLAHEMRLQVERNGSIDLLKGRVLCTLFYEPSTRTRTSFEAAMKRLGGEVVQVEANTSSVVKGETIADTIRTLGCYGDGIVIRHPAVGSAQTAAKFSPVPVLNAGDGVGEHPTQALLDIYTIRSELGTVNGRTITLLGDLKNGRTVHSLVTLLLFYSVRLNFVSPPSLVMPDSVINAVRRAGVSLTICESLEDVLGDTDVLYVTRVQKERFANEEEWQNVASSYVVNHALLARAKPDMIVMHPLPRVDGPYAIHFSKPNQLTV